MTTATVTWGTGRSVITGEPFTPQRVVRVHEYRGDRVLIEGRGRCPLWAGRDQIEVHR